MSPGGSVRLRVNADTVVLWHEGRRAGRHERCYSRQRQVLDLEHYLDGTHPADHRTASARNGRGLAVAFGSRSPVYEVI